MIWVLIFLATGLATGRLLQRPVLLGRLSALMMPVIYLLLFFMGLNTGSLPELSSQWATLGRDAITIALGATLGSVVASWILFKSVRRLREPAPPEQSASEGSSPRLQSHNAAGGILAILGCYLLGVAAGYLRWVPIQLLAPEVAFSVLYLLMFLAGVHTGKNRTLFRTVKRGGLTPLWVPAATIVGTLGGTLLVVPLLPSLSCADTLAIGSGMGYYSLSSLLIAKARGAELGTIALMANMARELLALTLAPLLVTYFGKLAPIAAGGATTMDTTLPGILKTSGPSYLFISLVNGFFTDLSVPLLVAFFLSL